MCIMHVIPEFINHRAGFAGLDRMTRWLRPKQSFHPQLFLFATHLVAQIVSLGVSCMLLRHERGLNGVRHFGICMYSYSCQTSRKYIYRENVFEILRLRRLARNGQSGPDSKFTSYVMLFCRYWQRGQFLVTNQYALPAETKRISQRLYIH